MKMKINSYIYCLWVVLVLVICYSCEKVDLHKGATFNQGLLNFSIAIPGQATEYPAEAPGPYNNGDTIIVKVPTTDDDPLDVTKLKPFASLENNSRIEPGLPGLMDFKNPVPITVITGDGEIKKFIIKVVPTLPRHVFKKKWFFNAEKMGIVKTNISGITVSEDQLLVADFNGTDIGVRIFDKNTGAFRKNIPSPASFCMQVVADDAGHFIVNTYNVYKKGFMVYYYENVDSTPMLILNYTDAAGCPEELGRKVSVIGNLKQGKAYLYATGYNDTHFYYWEFNDGVPVTEKPNIVKFSSAEPWNFATVKRKSLADNSDHYITYCVTNGNKGSYFSQFSPQMELFPMAKENHPYKILDFEVYELKGRIFMAALTQDFWAWDAQYLQVYDVTEPGKMILLENDPGFKDFMLFKSEAYGGVNYNKYGDVAVDVKDNQATIYASMASNENQWAGILSYKMQYNPQ